MQNEIPLKASAMLVPQVKRIVDLAGEFDLSTATIITDLEFMEGALLASKQLSEAWAGSPLPVLSNCDSKPKSITISLSVGDPDSEAYKLIAHPTGIAITSTGSAGLFHATQVLRQLALTCGSRIPCFECHDAPRFGWRGYMLDTSRHFLSVTALLKFIDIASLHRLNRFHWHLTDDQGWRLPVDSFPALTTTGAWRNELQYVGIDDRTIGGVYSHAEIRTIVAYAAERHVMVVPEIETPGHASAILAALPQLGCTKGPYQVEDRFGIFPDVLCAGQDTVLDFLDEVFNTVVQLFPSPFVHIGGDECPRTRWRECPDCQKRMREEHLSEVGDLQSWLTVRIARMLAEKGKRIIGWDEVLDGTQSLGLPKDVVVMSWRGVVGGLHASALGHQVIMCPNTEGCYLDYRHLDSMEESGNIGVSTVAEAYGFSPIPVGMDTNQQQLVLGGQGNLWTERVYSARQAEYQCYPRLAALAEALWFPTEEKDLEGFSQRLEIHKARLQKLDVHFYPGKLF